MNPLQSLLAWARTSRTNSIIAGCATLLIACCLCGGVAAAFNRGGTTTDNITTGQSSGNTTTTQQATNTPRPPTATPKPKAWVTIQQFSGNGISKTATFTITASQWKILWSCNPNAYGSSYNLIADLTVPGDSFGDSVVNVICTSGDASTTSGETMEYSQGTYYLDVNSEASWTFQVQVYQ